ncbi:MAG: hypothetical protein LBO80_03595 [Treponema sp.]|jgi:hypothetical protein|nr:hypothetical protein [Treponema sp.]
MSTFTRYPNNSEEFKQNRERTIKLENWCMKNVVLFAFIALLFLSAAVKNLSANPAGSVKEFVEDLNCPKVSAGDNKIGLSIKSIRKDGSV